MPLISIILPVYNAGERLQLCIDSILKQSFKDFELIIILDCPNDDSDKICIDRAMTDNRIVILVNDENIHTGLSRNKGLKVAKGKYITFIDHDDTLAEDALLTLYNQAEHTNADVVFAPMHSSDENDTLNKKPMPTTTDRHRAALTSLISDMGLSHFNLVIGTLYKRSSIEDIAFVDTRYIAPEDKLFNLDVLLKCKNVQWIDDSVYIHAEHNNNEGKSTAFLGYEKRIPGIELFYNKMTQSPLFAEYKEQVYDAIRRRAGALMFFTLFTRPDIHRFILTRKALKQSEVIMSAFKEKEHTPRNSILSDIAYHVWRMILNM